MKCIYDGPNDPLLGSSQKKAASLLRTAELGQIKERKTVRRVIVGSALNPFVWNGKWTGDALDEKGEFSLINDTIRKQMAKMIVEGDFDCKRGA